MSYEWHPEKFNKKLDVDIEKRLLKSALIVEKHSKIICPKVTGRLASSITHLVVMDPRMKSAFIIAGGKAFDGSIVFYAIFVEVGTRFFHGRFYMRRGLREGFPEIRKIWGIIG